MRKTMASIVALVSIVFLSGCSEGEIVRETVLLRPSNEPIFNPGKGWVLYGYDISSTPLKEEGVFAKQTDETWKVGSLTYLRLHWSDLEPNEGKFNWLPLDAAIAESKAKGKPFAFGIMCANSVAENAGTPAWVYEAGAKYTEGIANNNLTNEPMEYKAPVWDDPVFLDKKKNFVNAMSDRYDGNPYVAFIDARSYGNWGENHIAHLGDSVPISEDKVYNLHWKMFLDAFEETQIVTAHGKFKNPSFYREAAEAGMGFRFDGTCTANHAAGKRIAAELLSQAYGEAPVVLEFVRWYSTSYTDEPNGSFSGGYDGGLRFSYLLEQIEDSKATYVSMGHWDDDADIFLRERGYEIKQLVNRIGYHFTVLDATFEYRKGEEESREVSFRVENNGVAPIYIDTVVKAALLNEDGVVEDSFVLTDMDPRNWQPEATVLETFEIESEKLENGGKLAIGVFTDAELENPDIRVGNRESNEDNWLVLN